MVCSKSYVFEFEAVIEMAVTRRQHVSLDQVNRRHGSNFQAFFNFKLGHSVIRINPKLTWTFFLFHDCGWVGVCLNQ